MDKPNSAAIDREIEQAAKFSTDPGLQERLARKAYGDGLDRWAIREGVSTWSAVILMAAAVAMYCAGELVFAWQSGTDVMPGLKVGDWHFGGIVSVANSVLFILLVFLYIEDGRPMLGRAAKRDKFTGAVTPAVKGNAWTFATLATGSLAFFAIFVAQTEAANDVRKVVDKRDHHESEIKRLETDIITFAPLIPPRRPAELALERAQDEAVGSGLNTVTDGEAKILCADVADFEEKMTCRQKILRASVDCTRSVSTLVRDAACDPIKMAQSMLARIDEENARQDQRRADIKVNQDALAAMPEASNNFIRQIADWTRWSIPDAQSRTYVFIALLCLIVPAGIFANLLVRRPAPPAAVQPSQQQGA